MALHDRPLVAASELGDELAVVDLGLDDVLRASADARQLSIGHRNVELVERHDERRVGYDHDVVERWADAHR